MAADSSYVNYAGNAGLGSGSSAGIPVTSDKGLAGVNDLGQTLLQYDAQRNLNIFNQKVKDRDALASMLDGDQIPVDNILDQDRKMVDDANNSITDAWVDVNKNGGINNLEGMRKYKEKVQAAKNVATHAKLRYLQSVQQEKEIADSPLDSERAARKNNLDNWRNTFWSDVKPFQPATSLDHEGLLNFQTKDAVIGEDGQPLATQTTTTTQGPKGTTVQTKVAPIAAGGKGKTGNAQGSPSLSIFDYNPGSYVSFDAIRRNTIDGFSHDAQRQQDITKQAEMFATMPDGQFGTYIPLINKKLQEYNNFRGLKPGDTDYVQEFTPQDFVVGPDGLRHPNMPLPEFSAKLALAQMPSYGSKGGFVFNKDKATYTEGMRHSKEQEAIDWAKIGVDNKKLDFDVTKWKEEQKEPEQQKNAAMVYAANVFGDVKKLASLTGKRPDGTQEYILSPDDIRKMTQEQLTALGTFSKTKTKTDANNKDGIPATEATTTMTPLSIPATSALVLNSDGTIRVLNDAVGDDGKLKTSNGRILGNYDKESARTIREVATNRLMTENENSTGKERGAFVGPDTSNPNILVEESGGSKVSSGTNAEKSRTATGEKIYAKAKPVDANVDVSTLADGSYQLPNGKVAKVKRGKVISIQ